MSRCVAGGRDPTRGVSDPGIFRMLALPQPLMSTSEMSLAVSDHVVKVTDLCGSEEECAWNQVDLGLGHSSVTSGLKRAAHLSITQLVYTDAKNRVVVAQAFKPSTRKVE
ncbi:hypothetical protein U0070_019234, partial [Myodes glareolus]